MYIKLFLIFVIVQLKNVDSACILVVLPFGSKSHFIAFERYLNELVDRKHELVIISPFTTSKLINNTNIINTENYTDLTLSNFDINIFLEKRLTPLLIDSALSFNSMILNTTKFFQHPDVQRLLDSNENFDLVITELFETDAMLSFCYKFKTNCIVLSSCALLPWANPRFGNPDNPSYIPSRNSQQINCMNFWQRVINTVYLLTYKLAFYYLYTDTSQKIVNKYLGNDTPSLLEIGMNTSLILVNTHFSLHGVRPFAPNVIEVGGIHVRPAEKLPQSLEKFINESQHGVIYFCMGSILKASTLPEEKRRDIIEVFSKLPQRVLWKWETENMPDKPDNVKLIKWMPQRDILAHSNVKLFITHGGLLGITESVHSGVPIIGIPVFGDQTNNVAVVQAAGIGLRLDFIDLNKDTFYKAIKEILDNPKYKENARQLSIRFRDRPQTSLETAVYWTEYVIRHKGALHLKSAAVDLAWYQYLLLDVIPFLLISFAIISVVLYFMIRYICNFIRYLIIKNCKIEVNHARKNK